MVSPFDKRKRFLGKLTENFLRNSCFSREDLSSFPDPPAMSLKTEKCEEQNEIVT